MPDPSEKECPMTVRARPVLTAQLAAVGLVLLAATTACGGSGKVGDLASEQSLAPGACRQAATALNQLHRDVAALKSDKVGTPAQRASLAASQRQLQALRPESTAVTGRVAAVVEAVGFLRLGVDSHSYDSAVLTRADDAAGQLAKVCRAG